MLEELIDPLAEHLWKLSYAALSTTQGIHFENACLLNNERHIIRIDVAGIHSESAFLFNNERYLIHVDVYNKRKSKNQYDGFFGVYLIARARKRCLLDCQSLEADTALTLYSMDCAHLFPSKSNVYERIAASQTERDGF